MPIQLNYTDSDTSINVPNSHWAIIESHFDEINGLLRIVYGGFITLAAKNAGRRPLRFKQFIIPYSTISLANQTRSQIQGLVDTFSLSAIDENNIQFFSGGVIV